MNYSAAPDMFVPETQLSDSLSTNVTSPTPIPETQDTTPELSMDETDMFVPETQLSDSLSTNVPSPTTIPDTEDTTPELSMDETKESTTSESQLTGTVDVVPEMTSSDDVLPQDTDGIFSFNTETSVQVSGTGERSTRISQDSGFCETPSTFNRISKDSDIASQDSQEI